MIVKTVTLNGGETYIEGLTGDNIIVVNKGDSSVFVSNCAKIIAKSDNVVEIPAHSKDVLADYNGKIYLMGTGEVELRGVGSNFHYPLSDSSDSGEESITVLNPNLLMNSNFTVNQRGLDIYETPGITLDRWELYTSVSTCGTVSHQDDGVLLVSGGNINDTYLWQAIEHGEKLVGKTVTLSFEVSDVVGSFGVAQHGTGNGKVTVSSDGVYTSTFSIETWSSGIYRIMFYNILANSSFKIRWVKLEEGNKATQYVPPNYNDELERCQRHYQLRTTGTINEADLQPIMYRTPSVKSVENGLFAYYTNL